MAALTSGRSLSPMVRNLTFRPQRIYAACSPIQSQGTRRSISLYGYTQAKCLVYREENNPSLDLSLHTHSLSPPHGKLITLRTLAAPLNPADINQIAGTYPTPAQPRQDLGTTAPIYIPGNEGCFEVLSVGSDVRTVGKGDWVIPRRTGLGTWRTHAQVSEDAVTKIDDKTGLTPLQAGTVSVNPITAWRMLKDFEDLKEGDWWIQNGANSGVGRAALQLSKAWGLRAIAIVRPRETKQEQERLEKELKDMGAEMVLTAESNGPEGPIAWREQVKAATGGKAVKLGLNCVGGRETSEMVRTLGHGGTLVTYGGMSKKPLNMGAAGLIFKDLRFRGFWVTAWADRNPEGKKKTVDEVLNMYKNGTFKDVPYEEVKWDWDTKEGVLAQAVKGTLDGFRKGKGVFVFGDT